MKDKKTTTIIYLGLDISKGKLDLSGTEENKVAHQTFENSPKGIKELICRLKPLAPTSHIILEPTGGYERGVTEALAKAQITFSKIHPYQARAFATGIGKLAKTDKIDALVLAKFGEYREPRPTAPIEKAQEELRALYDHRQQLTNDRIRVTNRLETAPASIKSYLEESVGFVNQQLKAVNQAIEEYLSTHSEVQEKINRLQLVKGVGKQTATAFAVYMPELGKISGKAAVALVGVAPFNRDSGKTHSYRSIHYGRSQLRKTLYMAAICASQKNHILKEFYARLKAKGKPAKVAIVAVMRKLVMLLNHMAENPNFSLEN